MPNNILEMLPFVTLVAGELKINTAQVVQAILVAGFIALFASVLMIPKLQVTLENIEENLTGRIEKIEFDVEEIRRDFYKPQVSE